MTDVSGTPHLALDETLGAAYNAVVVASILLGVSFFQAWYYFSHQSDPWPTTLLVSAAITFNTIHQALITHSVYSYTVSNWGNTPFLDHLVRTLLVEVIFTGLTALLVQSFLTARIWILSDRNIWLTGVIGLLVVGEFGSILAYTILSLPLTTFAEVAHLKTLSITVNALAAAGDILIAGTLCTLLHLSRTGFHRSDTIYTKLIVFSLNTGLLTSLCAVASLVSILVAGTTFIYIAFFFCMGRLYTNSLLATLNARKRIRGLSDGIDTRSTGVGSLRFATRSTVLGARSSGLIGPQPNASYVSSTYRFIRDIASVSMRQDKVYTETDGVKEANLFDQHVC
ncbi:hypothetical protein K443DRAFT_676532 [Laccaria amethystina LaAM-08-1]|uniref:DUF6534 domain-containing protein n=1 Tax=Laccaria amethystina LaAM-08-1 TaxID=1095629 RepID=A0A0C9XFI7_9AGAR|nr:hypothetical protein K443DRAFT_676532 [Laccaria amethystina LaAM-08-1]